MVDNSALIEFLVGDGVRAEAVRASMLGSRLAAPELVDVEAVSVLRGLVRGGKLDARAAERVAMSLGNLALTRWSHTPLLARVWELRENLTPYDAVYVALAESLSARLLTCDARLAHASGIRCAVDLIS